MPTERDSIAAPLLTAAEIYGPGDYKCDPILGNYIVFLIKWQKKTEDWQEFGDKLLAYLEGEHDAS
jgi:hypothetical protein